MSSELNNEWNSEPTILKMEQVRFGYARRAPLFEQLDFALPPGEGIVGLLGRNGAGKTSLLKLASGLLFPTGGRIELFGRPAERRDPAGLARLIFLPEQIEVPGVSLATYLDAQQGYYPRFDRRAAERHLTDFAVPREGLLPELSLGQQKKVLIAAALASGTELVLLDEPTNGLDIPAKQVFRRLVTEVSRAGRSVVISTHQVKDVETLITRIVVLDGGRILFEADTTTVRRALRVQQFETEDAAGLAGALATDSRRESTTGLVPGAVGAEAGVDSGPVDLELLFQAAVSYPEELTRACEAVARGDAVPDAETGGVSHA